MQFWDKADRDELTRMLNEDGISVPDPPSGPSCASRACAVPTRAWKKTSEQNPQAKTAHREPHARRERQAGLLLRGAQHPAAEFQGWCAGNNVAQSMGQAGACRDNTVAENFFAHLKTEF
ncbi:MAG: hypothetical protein ABWY04_11220 [Arthrobacter sp.]